MKVIRKEFRLNQPSISMVSSSTIRRHKYSPCITKVPSNSLNLILGGQTITETFRLALQTLRGTYSALWQREWDAAIPQFAEAAGIDPDLKELLLRNSIMALTVHVLKDPRAGFKQKLYMEHNLFIGNHSTGGGVRVFLDRIDVLSTYLPLFPPILHVTYQELINQEKQLMIFDALPKELPYAPWYS
jgi:hypothetical protein